MIKCRDWRLRIEKSQNGRETAPDVQGACTLRSPLYEHVSITVLFVAARVPFGIFSGFQLGVWFAAFIQCGKHQIRIHRLLQGCRLWIMAVFDIGQIAPQLFQQVDKLGDLLFGQ